jgi:methylated-DNA-[protein]-cysteine S-methyltransferase
MEQVNLWKHASLKVPCGLITILFNEQGICSLLLGRKENALQEYYSTRDSEEELPWPALKEDLQQYFQGKPLQGTYPLLMEGYTPWTLKVLRLTQTIPFGETCSYKELAIKAGSPAAARAVGQAMARNRTPILIPCHRVVGQNGTLTGFGYGLDWKSALLKIEGIKGIRGY